MEQYIKKSALVAEIDRLQETTMDENRNFLSSYHEGIFDGLSIIEGFLDTIGVKEVDLGKEAENFVQTEEFVKNESPVLAIAKHFFELGIGVRLPVFVYKPSTQNLAYELGIKHKNDNNVMDEKQSKLCEKCMNAPINSKERAQILTECRSQSCWYKGY